VCNSCVLTVEFRLPSMYFLILRRTRNSTLFPYTTLFRSAADKGKDTRDYLAAAFPELNAWERAGADASSAPARSQALSSGNAARSEERFSRNAETDIVCRLLLEKKQNNTESIIESKRRLS